MHYEDLRIYKLSKKLREELYRELIKIPHYWTIEEVVQAIRSSSSAVSNIVEGHGRKFYPNDYYRFLDISMASSDETQDHVVALGSKNHINKDRVDYFKNNYKTLAIQTLNYMNWLRKKYNLHPTIRPSKDLR